MSKAKTTEKSTEISLEKSSFLDYFDEGSLGDWLSEHGKNILYGLAGLLGIIFLIYALSSGQTSKAEQEYIQAANDFAYFSRAYDSQNQVAATDALARLKALISKHPELHATYDGAVAQILLNRGQTEEALPYANSTLARVKSNNLPFYTDYAQNTLLISQKSYKQALENTLALQQKMKEAMATPPAERTFGDELFALNLLRIAMLQQEQGDKTTELQTWQEWKQYAGLNGNRSTDLNINQQAFRTVIQQLAIGSFSLPDYISHRENILKK